MGRQRAHQIELNDAVTFRRPGVFQGFPQPPPDSPASAMRPQLLPPVIPLTIILTALVVLVATDADRSET
jgi:hypothetical protein